MQHPKLIVVFSGKRKCGKDFIAAQLQTAIGNDVCDLLHLSAPLKYQYAQDHELDYNLLLTSGSYKEQFREDMIKWGEEMRRKDPNYFCKLASSACFNKAVWLVADARRPTDIEYFKKTYDNVVLVRINASDVVRSARGWNFTKGVDDCESECALDSGISWDYVITNNDEMSDSEACNHKIKDILTLVYSRICS